MATSEAKAVEERLAGVSQDELESYKKMFSAAREATMEQRGWSALADDYYNDVQWTSQEIRALNKRKQPVIWINRIKPSVNGVLGVLEQGASDPRAYPRNTTDENAAEIATDCLRYAADRARWGRVKLKSGKDYLIGGTCAVIMEVDEDGEIAPTRIRWQEFFADPHSQEEDFSDATYMGVAKWMYAKQLANLYNISVDIPTGNLAAADEFDEDRPSTTWGDTKRKRVLVVELYHNDRGWKRCVFYGSAVLEEGDSPYQDEKGRPSCPIVAQSVYIDRQNRRTGIVRSMVPIQDEINMRRSKLLHMVNSRQLKQTEITVETSAKTASEQAARPDGVVPWGYDYAPTTDMTAGQAQLLQEAKAELERQGPSPDTLGRQSASASGRAHLIRQQAGLTELTPAIGGLEDWELRCYRQMWERIKQFWTTEKLIRVTDDIGAPKFLTINQVVGQQMVMGPEGPVMQPVVHNRPAEIDVDIIIDSTPDSATVQQEQFTELVKLAGVYGPQEVPFDDVLEASALPRKRELLEKRQARQEQQAQGQQPNPLQMAAMQAELQNKAADTEQKHAKAFKDVASAHLDQAHAVFDHHARAEELRQADWQARVDALLALNGQQQPQAPQGA